MGVCCGSSLSASNRFIESISDEIDNVPSPPSLPATPLYSEGHNVPFEESHNRVATSVNINGTCVAIPWGLTSGVTLAAPDGAGAAGEWGSLGSAAGSTESPGSRRKGPRLHQVQQKMKATRYRSAPMVVPPAPLDTILVTKAEAQPIDSTTDTKRHSESKTDDLSTSTTGAALLAGWCDPTAAPRTPTSSSVSRTPLQFFKLAGEEGHDTPKAVSAHVGPHISAPVLASKHLNTLLDSISGDVTAQEHVRSAPTALPVPLSNSPRKQIGAAGRLQQLDNRHKLLLPADTKAKSLGEAQRHGVKDRPAPISLSLPTFSSVLPTNDVKTALTKASNEAHHTATIGDVGLFSFITNSETKIIELSPREKVPKSDLGLESPSSKPTEFKQTDNEENTPHMPITATVSTPQNISLLIDAAWCPDSINFSRQSVFLSESRRTSSAANLKNARGRRKSSLAAPKHYRDVSRAAQANSSVSFENHSEQTHSSQEGGAKANGAPTTLLMGRAARLASSTTTSNVASPTSPFRRQSTNFSSPRVVSVSRNSSSATRGDDLTNDSLFCFPETVDPVPPPLAPAPSPTKLQAEAAAKRKALLDAFLVGNKQKEQLSPHKNLAIADSNLPASCVRINMDHTLFATYVFERSVNNSASHGMAPSMRSTTLAEALLCALGGTGPKAEKDADTNDRLNTDALRNDDLTTLEERKISSQTTTATHGGKSAAALEAENRFYEHLRRAMSFPSLMNTSNRQTTQSASQSAFSREHSPNSPVTSPLGTGSGSHRRTISDFAQEPIPVAAVSSRPATPTRNHAATLFNAINSGNAMDRDEKELYGSLMASRSVSFAVTSTTASTAMPILNGPFAGRVSSAAVCPILRKFQAFATQEPPATSDASSAATASDSRGVSDDSVGRPPQAREAMFLGKYRAMQSPLETKASSSYLSPTSDRPQQSASGSGQLMKPLGFSVGGSRSIERASDLSLQSDRDQEDSSADATSRPSSRAIFSIHGGEQMVISNCNFVFSEGQMGSGFTSTATTTQTATTSGSAKFMSTNRFVALADISPADSGAAVGISGVHGSVDDSYVATMPVTARRDVDVTLDRIIGADRSNRDNEQPFNKFPTSVATAHRASKSVEEDNILIPQIQQESHHHHHQEHNQDDGYDSFPFLSPNLASDVVAVQVLSDTESSSDPAPGSMTAKPGNKFGVTYATVGNNKQGANNCYEQLNTCCFESSFSSAHEVEESTAGPQDDNKMNNNPKNTPAHMFIGPTHEKKRVIVVNDELTSEGSRDKLKSAIESNSHLHSGMVSQAGLTQLSLQVPGQAAVTISDTPLSSQKDSGVFFQEVSPAVGAPNTVHHMSPNKNLSGSLSSSQHSAVQLFSGDGKTESHSFVSIAGKERGYTEGGDDSFVGHRRMLPPLPEVPFISGGQHGRTPSLGFDLWRQNQISPSVSASQQHFEDLPYVPMSE